MADNIINVRTGFRIRDGFFFAWGVVAFIGVAIIYSYFIDWLVPSPYDSSDSPPARSGLRIKTDHLTGCQYFVTAIGAITPRMNADGKQVCARSSAGLEQPPSKRQVAGSNPAERPTPPQEPR